MMSKIKHIEYGKCKCGRWHGYYDNGFGVNEVEALRQEIIIQLFTYMSYDAAKETYEKMDRLVDIAEMKVYKSWSEKL